MRRSSVYVATEMSSRLTSQILMLYYVLTYQDCLLSNMKSLGGVLLTIPGTLNCIYQWVVHKKLSFWSRNNFFLMNDQYLISPYMIYWIPTTCNLPCEAQEIAFVVLLCISKVLEVLWLVDELQQPLINPRAQSNNKTKAQQKQSKVLRTWFFSTIYNLLFN